MINKQQSTKDLLKVISFLFVVGAIIGFLLVWKFGSEGIGSMAIFFYALAYYPSYLIGAIVAFATIPYFGLNTKLGKAFFFFGLGLLGVVIATLLWDYYELFSGSEEVPVTSPADFFYLLLAPLSTISLLYLISIYKIQIKIVNILIALIVAVGWVITVGYFTESPILSLFEAGDIESITYAMYMITDGLTAGVATLFLLLSRGKLAPTFRIFGFGFLIYAAANAIYIYRTTIGTYFTGDWGDILYIFAGVFMTYAIGKIRVEFLEQGSTSSDQRLA